MKSSRFLRLIHLQQNQMVIMNSALNSKLPFEEIPPNRSLLIKIYRLVFKKGIDGMIIMQ